MSSKNTQEQSHFMSKKRTESKAADNAKPDLYILPVK